LALLAILAAGRGRPVTRDRIVALLWPEADTERARHFLADSIYVLRSALGKDVITAIGDDLSFNPDSVSCDMVEFRRALDDGQRAGAVGIYARGGPFLDGVHFSGVPEFEHWVESVRDQLAAEYRRALESLAADAATRGRHSESAAWWRQLAADDPLSSRAALGLMRTLVDAGDVTGALEFARVHEKLVRAELETRPDPAVLRLTKELRRGDTHSRAGDTSDGAQQSAETVAVMRTSVLEQTDKERPRSIEAAAALSSTAPPSRPPWSTLHRWPIGVVVVPLIAATLFVALHRRQDAISLAPASPLDSIGRGHTTHNLAAYELYLRGRDPAMYRTDSSQRAAINYLERAIALDPRFAAAYAELAALYAVGGSWGQPSASLREQREMFAKAEAMALKARDLDDSLSYAHTTLAFVRMRQYDLPSAAEELKRALMLDSSDTFAHEFQGLLYWWTERPAAAVAEESRAVRVDPLSAEANVELAHAFYFARRYDEAFAQIRKVNVVPPFRRAVIYLAEIDMARGKWESAITALRALPPNRVRGRALLGYALGRAGERTEATGILSELIIRWKAGTSGAFDVATVCAGLGDFDEAFAWLNRAFDDRSLSVEIMTPLFDDIRADQRFELVRQRLRIAEARTLLPRA
jgi:DNA-binding SARP family transcriptional activator